MMCFSMVQTLPFQCKHLPTPLHSINRIMYNCIISMLIILSFNLVRFIPCECAGPRGILISHLCSTFKTKMKLKIKLEVKLNTKVK